jgi:hypothetical protein
MLINRACREAIREARMVTSNNALTPGRLAAQLRPRFGAIRDARQRLGLRHAGAIIVGYGLGEAAELRRLLSFSNPRRRVPDLVARPPSLSSGRAKHGPVGGVLRMRKFLSAIKALPHAEERLQARLEACT